MKIQFQTKSFILSILFSLFLIPNVKSQNLNYSWVGGSSTDFSNVNNWEENSTLNPPSDFLQAGDVFDFGAASGLASTFDLAGVTLGEITIKKGGGGSVTLENSGTLTISSAVLPIFGTGIAVNFAKSGSTIKYTAQPAAASAVILTQYTHNNVELNWNTTINSTTVINGSLTVNSNYNLEILAGTNIGGNLNASTGNVTISGGTNISGNLNASTGNVTINSSTTIGGNLNISTGNVTVNSSTSIGGYMDAIAGNFTIGANTTVTGDLKPFTGTISISTAGTLNVKGSTGNFGGSISSSGAVIFDGTVGDFSGAITTSGPLTFNGTVGNFTGNITSNNATGVIKFNNSVGQFTSTITINNSSSLHFLSTVNSFSGSILNYGTITLGLNCSLNSSITGIINLIEGGVTDMRNSNIFPGTWIYSIKPTSTLSSAIQYVYPGTYTNLDIRCVARLSGNVTVSNELILNNLSSGNRLELYSYTLTISGTVKTGSSNYLRSASNATGSLIINSPSKNIGTIYFTSTELKDLTITNGAIVTLGNTLNITAGSNYGTVLIDTLSTCSTGNNLILKSNSTGSARIGKSSGKIIGEYTVEKYIPADRDYRFISSPVVNGTALQLRDNKGSTAGRGIQITGNNPTSINDFDASTLNNPSAYYYAQDSAGDITTVSKIAGATDDPGWRPFWNGNSFKLINGKGYRIFVRGDRSINLTQSGQAAKTTTIWTKGTYPGYSVTIPVYNSGRSKTNNGINFIGNPYPSSIDWNLIQKTNIDSGYMVYNNSNQSFVGWNGVTGSAGQYISAYQGILVKCTNTAGGSLTIHERTKTTQTGGSFFQQKLTNHLKITMTYDSSYNSDAYLHFRNDAINTYDGNDIQQMLNNGTNVATLDDAGMPYNINSMGTLDSFKSIPLSVEGTPAAELKLSFYDVASFSNHKLELIDNYLKKTTPIVEAMDYTFSITNDSWSYKNGRFFINLTKQENVNNKIIRLEKIGILYPNPVKDKINISLEKNYNNGKFQIVNALGQEIMTGDIKGKTKTIDAKNFSSGIYYLNIFSNGTTQNIKFVK